MSAIIDKEFDRNLMPRERHRGFPRLALRQRSADHPMILFFVVAAAAFAARAAVPPTGAAFTSFGAPLAPAISGPEGADAPKTVGLSEVEIACHGQVWGAESAECLATISRESGRTDDRRIRVIAGA